MILDIKNIHKNFGGLKALDGVTCKVEKGKITAIIGPNGSGKSTLFNVISGLVRLESGSINYGFAKLTSMKDYAIARLGISRTFQEVRLFHNMTIREHIQMAMSTSDEGLFSSLLSKNDRQDDKEIKKVLELVHLHKSLDTIVTQLSYGQRKLLDLAIALAKPHSLLMLDEPVAGVNPKLRKEIKQILRELNRRGETILVIEHDMNFIMDIADQIIVMDEGKVLVEGKPKEIQNDKKVLEAYLGQ